MKTINIQDWKFGLDTRRTELTSQLGTLLTLENAFINQGAEIEGRKSFVKKGQLPNGCFDIVALPTGLVTFGSINAPAMPAGLTGLVTYQKLTHPFHPGISSDDPTPPTMTGIVASRAFNNQTVAVASYANYVDPLLGIWHFEAASYMFVNGLPVWQQALGKVTFQSLRVGLTGISDQAFLMAKALTEAFPSNYDLQDLFVGELNTALGNAVTITGPTDEAFTVTVQSNTLTDNALDISDVGSKSQDEVLPIGAVATIYIVSGSSGSITALVDYNSVSLISAAVPYHTSIYQTALDLAANINALTGTTGYSATAVLASTKVAGLVLTAPTNVGATPNTQNATITTTTLKTDVLVNGTGATGAVNFPFSGGITGVAAAPQVTNLVFEAINGNTTTQWAMDDTWGFVMTLNNVFYTIANGTTGDNVSFITGKVPTFLMPLANKVYAVDGINVNFSKINDATLWEQQDFGAGFLKATDQFSNPSEVVALAPYQGRLAVFCSSTISIWTINADPTQYNITQTLSNIGTVAPLSVQPVGNLDVVFLSTSGFRSLRHIDSSLNALQVDIGSPVDSLVVAALRQGVTNVCGIVDPTTKTYWCYLNDGNIYVLSYFPELKIQAWSTFKPTDNNGTTFVPKKLEVYNNQIYILDTNNNIYLYGGDDNNTYDGSVVTVVTPWLDNQSPTMYKGFESVDVGMQGKWNISAGCDPYSGTLEPILTNGTAATPDVVKDSTFDIQTIPYIANGTHFQLKAVSDASNVGVVKLASILLKYEPQNEK